MVEIPQKVQNQLKKHTKWYHATTLDQLGKLLNGISTTYNLGRELDFGAGFYLTNDIDKACRYINSVIGFDGRHLLDEFNMMDNIVDVGIILEFNIDFHEVFMNNKQYKTKVFPNYSYEFAEFVFRCRTNRNDKTHDYDFIYGVQSDGKITENMYEFWNLGISEDDTIKKIMMDQMSFKQLSVHNQLFCDNMYISNIYYSIDKKEMEKPWK